MCVTITKIIAFRSGYMNDKVTNYSMIKELRSKHSLTQRTLSEKTGVSLGTIKMVETGRISLTSENAQKLSHVFKCSPDIFYQSKVRNTRVITVAIQKGGAGKTAISTNLAYALSELKQRVLFIDTDPQMNASSLLGFGKDSHPSKNFYDAYINNDALIDHIESSVYNDLDIIPGSHKLADIDLSASHIPMRERHMDKMIHNLRLTHYYDFVVIDTNPALGLFNTSIIYSSDEVLIPVNPDQQTLDMLELFLLRLKMVQEYNDRVHLLGIVYSMREKNKSISKSFMDTLKTTYKEKVLSTEIDRLVTVPEAVKKRLPVGVYRPHSKSAKQYRELAQEVIKIVKKREAK